MSSRSRASLVLLCAAVAAITLAPAFAGPGTVQSLGATVTLPRNSHDGLAAALAAAGSGGTVIIASGYHFESATVVIDHPVTILGQGGASLLSNTTPSSAGTQIPVQAALHVRGTAGVTIKGLELRPTGESDGNTGVLIENSSDVLVEANYIRRYQFGILIQNGDRADINRNTIAVSSIWQDGLSSAFGITDINGRGVNIRDNRVTNALFAIWACDLNGRATGNTVSNSVIGLILCNVPAGAFLISGNAVGSVRPGAWWDVRNNYAANNAWGYLVIDGANNNTIVSNAATGSQLYDLELTTDTYRFGFLTPAAFDNTVNVGPYKDQKVKDCGVNNVVTGVTLINNATDPCF